MNKQILKFRFFIAMFFILSSILILSACTSINNDNLRNPRINNDSFTNFVPWWAGSNNMNCLTNNSITNGVSR